MTRYRFDQIAENSTAKKKPEESDRNRYVGLEHLDPGTLEVTRWGAEVTPKGDKLLMKKGDILFGRRRAYQKKVGIAPFDGIFSAHGMVLRPKADVVDPMFFPFFISSDIFLDEAIRVSVGSLSPTANWKDLRTLEFDLPSPGKQRELAGILSEAESLKGHYRKLLTTCDDVVKSQFVEMFGDLRFNNKLMPIRALNEVASSRLGKMLDSKHQTGEWRRPYLTNRNVQWFRFDFQEVNSMDFPPADQKEFSLLPGDLLVCEGGEVGRCAIWRGQMKDCYFQKALHRVRCGNAIIPEYLCWWFKMMADEGLLTRHANTATITHLSGVQLKQLGVLVPPLSLQQEFADFVAQVDKSKFAVQKALDELNATTKKILNQELGLGDV